MAELQINRAILVGIADSNRDISDCERSLDELERLLDTAGGVAFSKVLQVKANYDPRTCIGSGKVAEIKDLCSANNISLVVFDIELTSAQIRNLEADMDNLVSVIDRSMLILDIFALHAKTAEGKLQVELAQLRYSAPRLLGKGTELSRQGGGIGSRGPGESKLETDRRHLRERIQTLERRLEELEHNRMIMRAQRDRSGLPKLALVGYTNSGKSTLLNRLTDAGVLSEDKLFATLDPTTRKLELPSGESVLITDTVGFVRKLPHHLVDAFKSTLDEVRYADILLIVTDISDSEASGQIAVTKEVIEELGASDKPIIYVNNKFDLCENINEPPEVENTVFVSAATGYGIETLLSAIEAEISRTKRRLTLVIPYSEQSIVSALYDKYTVHSVDYVEDGVEVDVVLDQRGIGLYNKYIKC